MVSVAEALFERCSQQRFERSGQNLTQSVTVSRDVSSWGVARPSLRPDGRRATFAGFERGWSIV